jgi:citrate synthase
LSADKVSIDIDGKVEEYAVIPATQGPSGIDISNLITNTGLTVFDKGILRYRGYPIEQLAANKSFLETSYLLIHGELPTAAEAEEFDQSLRRHTLIHEGMKDFFKAFPQNAHPMSVISAGVSALSTFYQDSLDTKDPEQVEISTLRLLAKLPVIASYAYKSSIGQALVYPDNSYSLVENFLKMTFGNYAEDYSQNSVVTQALDTLLLLHADHEQNCSTSTVRLVGSSNANLFASVASGINALSGPSHGGANEAVLEMLSSIQNSGESVSQYVDRIKNKEDGIRLMGFGHRIYKSFDPRATIVKQTADQVLDELGINDPMLEIAKELEAVALSDEYFAERKLYPNVDFYTGVIYKALGFPPRMFTPLFAVGRLPGWIAHWREMMEDPSTRIGRPQQLYTGPTERSL